MIVIGDMNSSPVFTQIYYSEKLNFIIPLLYFQSVNAQFFLLHPVSLHGLLMFNPIQFYWKTIAQSSMCLYLCSALEFTKDRCLNMLYVCTKCGLSVSLWWNHVSTHLSRKKFHKPPNSISLQRRISQMNINAVNISHTQCKPHHLKTIFIINFKLNTFA